MATQLDRKNRASSKKAVLALSHLQTPWTLALDIEQVDLGQVTTLQHQKQWKSGEAQVKITTIYNTRSRHGLKTLRVRCRRTPRMYAFKGDQVADLLPVPKG